MESLSSVVVLFTAVYAVAQRDSINPGLAGLVITYSITVRTGGCTVVSRREKQREPMQGTDKLFFPECLAVVDWRSTDDGFTDYW